MNELETNNTYSEVRGILDFVCKEDYDKIPKDIIKLIEDNANSSYSFKYNPNKTLNEQNVSKSAKTIIAILFRDYWATPEQKEKILIKEKQDELLEEKDKNEKYSYNQLFEKNQKNNDFVVEENLSLIEKKTHWYNKIFEKILKIFRRQKYEK